MKNLLTLLFLFFFSNLFAQNTVFTSVIAADSADQAYDMYQSSAGDFYLLNATNSYGSGGKDIQVTKTDGLGNVLWSYAYGTSGSDVGFKIKPANDGGILVCGYSDGFTTVNGDDALLLKLTSTGTISWVKTLAGPDADRYHDFTQNSSGDIYATGYSDVDSLGLNILLAKYTSSGGLFFSKTFGDIGDDIGNGIIRGRQGRFLIVGETDNDSVNIGPTGDKDIMLIEVNANGGVINSKNVGTLGDDRGISVVASNDYRYIVLAETFLGGGGFNDVLVFEVDTNFSISNSYWFGTPVNEYPHDIRLIQNNTLFIAGTLQGTISPQEVFLYNITRNGALSISGVFGGIASDGDTRVAVAGDQVGNMTLYASGNSFGGTNSEDGFLVKADDQLMTFCVDVLETPNSGSLSLQTASFDTSFSFGSAVNRTLTRTTVTAMDSALCCQLKAKVAADSFEICEGSSIRIGSNDISGYNYSWTAAGSTWTSSSANPNVSPTVNTSYKLIVSADSGSCAIDSGFVYVSVDTLLDVSSLPDTSICEGESVTLIAPSGFISYTWTVGGSIFSNDSLTVTGQDTAYLLMLDNNSCSYRDTVIVTENPIPVFSLGPDTTICDNEPITLRGPSGMANYKWNGTNTTSDSLVTTVSQTHTLEVTTSAGCKFQDQIRILTNPSSPLDLGPDTSFCEGTTYTINAPGALTGFLWNDSFSTGASYDATVAGTYWVEAFNSLGCTSYDTIVLTTLAAPEFSLGNDTTVCDEVNLTLSGPNGADSYLWFNGTSMQTYTATGPGLFYLTVTNAADCKYTDTIIISMVMSPNISLGNDTTICLHKPITLSPGAGFSSYVWSTSETTESITVATKGDFSVTVTDGNGCMAADTIAIDTMSCPNSVVYLDGLSYTVYPNPSKGIFHLESTANIVGSTIEIYSVNGKVQKVIDVYNNHQRIDVSDLPAGIYHLKLVSDNKSVGFKVSILR